MESKDINSSVLAVPLSPYSPNFGRKIGSYLALSDLVWLGSCKKSQYNYHQKNLASKIFSAIISRHFHYGRNLKSIILSTIFHLQLNQGCLSNPIIKTNNHYKQGRFNIF